MGSETLWTGVISRGTRGNGVPTVKVLRAHYGRHCESFSGKKMYQVAGFCAYNLCRSASRGVWTQTPISAWLASVPLVTVLRNDHWLWTLLLKLGWDERDTG